MGMFSIGIRIEDGLYCARPTPYRQPETTAVQHLENAGLSFEEVLRVLQRVISRRYLDAVIKDHAPTAEDAEAALSLHGPDEIRPRLIEGLFQ